MTSDQLAEVLVGSALVAVRYHMIDARGRVARRLGMQPQRNLWSEGVAHVVDWAIDLTTDVGDFSVQWQPFDSRFKLSVEARAFAAFDARTVSVEDVTVAPWARWIGRTIRDAVLLTATFDTMRGPAALRLTFDDGGKVGVVAANWTAPDAPLCHVGDELVVLWASPVAQQLVPWLDEPLLG